MQPQVTLLPTVNGSNPRYDGVDGHWPESPERSPCVAGIIPVIYYSVLLSLGLPGEWGPQAEPELGLSISHSQFSQDSEITEDPCGTVRDPV